MDEARCSQTSAATIKLHNKTLGKERKNNDNVKELAELKYVHFSLISRFITLATKHTIAACV
jgi:hypothetical protein